MPFTPTHIPAGFAEITLADVAWYFANGWQVMIDGDTQRIILIPAQAA